MLFKKTKTSICKKTIQVPLSKPDVLPISKITLENLHYTKKIAFAHKALEFLPSYADIVKPKTKDIYAVVRKDIEVKGSIDYKDSSIRLKVIEINLTKSFYDLNAVEGMIVSFVNSFFGIDYYIRIFKHLYEKDESLKLYTLDDFILPEYNDFYVNIKEKAIYLFHDNLASKKTFSISEWGKKAEDRYTITKKHFYFIATLFFHIMHYFETSFRDTGFLKVGCYDADNNQDYLSLIILRESVDHYQNHPFNFVAYTDDVGLVLKVSNIKDVKLDIFNIFTKAVEAIVGKENMKNDEEHRQNMLTIISFFVSFFLRNYVALFLFLHIRFEKIIEIKPEFIAFSYSSIKEGLRCFYTTISLDNKIRIGPGMITVEENIDPFVNFRANQIFEKIKKLGNHEYYYVDKEGNFYVAKEKDFSDMLNNLIDQKQYIFLVTVKKEKNKKGHAYNLTFHTPVNLKTIVETLKFITNYEVENDVLYKATFKILNSLNKFSRLILKHKII